MNVLDFLTCLVPKILDCWRFKGVPGGFAKVQEACRKNVRLVAPLKNSVVTSYDQKTCSAILFQLLEAFVPVFLLNSKVLGWIGRSGKSSA